MKDTPIQAPRAAKDDQLPAPARSQQRAKSPAPSPGANSPRVSLYAKTRFVWIYPEATTDFQWIGYLWTGGSVPLRSARPVYGKGCDTGWYAIEPRGFVCADGTRATIKEQEEVYETVKSLAGNLHSPWPHLYAESLGAPLYSGFPLASVASPLSLPKLPPTIFEPYNELSRRSTVAYVKEFRAGESDWLLTADFQWMAKRKVTPYARSEFEGVPLAGNVRLPIAFFRKEARAKYRKTDAGLEQTRETWPRLGWIPLTGASVTQGDETFLEVAGENAFVRAKDAVLPLPRARTPWGAEVGQADTTGLAPKGRATWIEASVRGGWLIAYEGTRPVFATLMSAGRGGIPVPHRPPLETASTPTGSFPVSGKFATATMANDVVVHSAVPWTQNFNGAYALHAAYWHNDFGELKSSGCLNVSPKDGKFLFEFTEPKLPAGWHGVRWVPKYEASTMVYVIE